MPLLHIYKRLGHLPCIFLTSNSPIFLSNFNTHLHNQSTISALEFHNLIKCRDLHLPSNNSVMDTAIS